MSEEWIVALASAPGPAAIAIVRISGQGCIPTVTKFLPNLSSALPRKAFLGEFIDPKTTLPLDHPMAIFFKGPNSYTGEDSVEIYFHGSPFVVRQGISLLINGGFRLAQPGEFTRRALLNGKIDLSQAEGIGALTHANSEQEWKAALQLASGDLYRYIMELRQELTESLAFLAARIDFPDEDEPQEVLMTKVDQKVQSVEKKMNSLLSGYDSGRVSAHGLSVAILGKPNAGKSSLLNQLLKESRSIVTDIPGTTRDYISENCLVEGRLLQLIDTAGLRNTVDPVEKIGISKSYELAQSSDLILYLLSCETEDIEEKIDSLSSFLQTKDFLPKTIILQTKSDLGKTYSDLPQISQIKRQYPEISWIDLGDLHTSNPQGLESLTNALVSRVDCHVKAIGDQPFITHIRHKKALEEGIDGLNSYWKNREQGAYDEVLAFELQEIANSLEQIVGAVAVDDVLDVVFSTFCIGK